MAEDEFDSYVLQGNYGGVTGWEDLTADETLEGIKGSMRDYLENEPNTALRVVKLFKSGKRVKVHSLNLWQ